MEGNSTNSPFPNRLKEARKAIGISQKELGIRIGLDEFTASPRMNQYEKGKHAPAFSVVKAISQELGIPTAFFYCEEDELAAQIRLYKL